MRDLGSPVGSWQDAQGQGAGKADRRPDSCHKEWRIVEGIGWQG